MSKDVADAIRYAAKWLGTGDAASTMGALEFVGSTIRDGAETIAAPFHDIAERAGDLVDAINNVSDSLDAIAKAISEREESSRK